MSVLTETIISQTEPDKNGSFTQIAERILSDGTKQNVTKNMQRIGLRLSKHAGWLSEDAKYVAVGPNGPKYRSQTMTPFGSAKQKHAGITEFDAADRTFDRVSKVVKPVVSEVRASVAKYVPPAALRGRDFDEPTVITPSTGGKYVPPAARKDFVEEPRAIYISNLWYDCTEDELRGIMAVYGRIERFKFGWDEKTESCKGWATVTYAMPKSATAAIEALNKARFHHTVIDVAWSNKQ